MSGIPTATVSRLATYLHMLTQLEAQNVTTTSSEHLADETHISAFQVRKDLAYFGRFGTRGAGYTVATLRLELRRILGLTRPWNVAVVGMGRMGEAVVNYPNFAAHDFLLTAAFDIDPAKVGQEVAGLTVRHPEALPQLVLEKDIDIGFITVTQEAAQEAADALVAAGIKGILNFAPCTVEVSAEVHVEPVDFLVGLKRLSFYLLNPEVEALASQQ